MKKKIEQIINGTFEYEIPKLVFSKNKIEVYAKEGENQQDRLQITTKDNQKIQGYISSSNRRFVLGVHRFAGTSVKIDYGIDVKGLKSGEFFEGKLMLITNAGEYEIPFFVEIGEEKVHSVTGEVHNLREFAVLAKEDFRDAFHLFTGKYFPVILQGESAQIQAMYKGMTENPVTYQHLEEFLIGSGLKEPVKIHLKEQERRISEISQSSQEYFVIGKDGWGHLRIEVEAQGEFLEAVKHVISEEDFIGSIYRVPYLIHEEAIGKGIHYGRIRLKTPYQELIYNIKVTRSKEIQVSINAFEKKQKVLLAKNHLEFLMGKVSSEDYRIAGRMILKELKENGCAYAEYQMYEAYLYLLENRKEMAGDLLENFKEKSFSRGEEELAGSYLYLRWQAEGCNARKNPGRKIRSLYQQKEDSYLLMWLYLQTNEEVSHSLSKMAFLMEEQYEKGCRSPFLYLEAFRLVEKEMSFFHRLTPFWVQVMLFAGKNQLLSQELAMRIAYLSGYEKEFYESTYQLLALAYERLPEEESLDAVCKYIMKGNPRKPAYFQWFELAVERGLRLTRLYEYYIETMNSSYQRELPKTLLLYFSYNSSTLGDKKKAYVYANVINHKDTDPHMYELYREAILEFAQNKLAEGRINEDYAVIYQEFLSEPSTREAAERYARMLFTYRVYCDDPKVRYIVVRHSQLEREEVYPCVHGVAYPRIYTDDAVILFRDEQQRRYVSTVDYNKKKLLDETKAGMLCLAQGCQETGLLLWLTQTEQVSLDIMGYYQKLLDNKAFSEVYQVEIRKQILKYYREHQLEEELEYFLKRLDYEKFASVDKKTLLEILIDRGMYQEAYGVISEFGYEGLLPEGLLKLCTRLITEREGREDEELLALARYIYLSGKYDEEILTYLMRYDKASLKEMFSLHNSAQGFGLDTYQLEEQILYLLMFTEDYREEGTNILKSYVQNMGREKILSAYLTFLSYGAFMKKCKMPVFVSECLKSACMGGWDLNDICYMALLEHMAKHRQREDWALLVQLLEYCMNRGYIFGFYSQLDFGLLAPYQLEDKTFVEYRTNPDSKVTLYYRLDTGLGKVTEYKSEPLKSIYPGVFVKTFTLFFGEKLEYYFIVEHQQERWKSKICQKSMEIRESAQESKYELLNRILAERKAGQMQQVDKLLKQYLNQEQYVQKMYTIEKEPPYERD